MAKQHETVKFSIKYYTKLLALPVLYVNATQATELNNSVELSFESAIKTAQKNDPWLTGNVHKQKAIELMSQAANTLPDPMVSISLANLPVNGFDFAQEGMTQAKFGIAQLFPRGDSLAIKSGQLKTQSEALPFQRANRQAQVGVTVGSLWLDVYRVQQSIALIEKNRSLFEQLAEVAQVSYSSALGKTRQQDIVRSQLELTRLDDRLNVLAQQENRYQGMLSQWLSQFSSVESSMGSAISASDFSIHNIITHPKLPEIELINADLVWQQQWLKPMALLPYFSYHPAVLAVEKKIAATSAGISLAEQKYKAQWGVNASYGYRADDAMGSSRADLFSVGVTFDLPLFTENKQDKERESAIYESESIKTEKILLLRELMASYASAKGQLVSLKQRQDLYKNKLLPQVHDQAQASLSAYTNDDGDFSEVVRSRIAVLNSEIDELTLNVEEQKIRLELNYLFIGNLNTAISRSSKIINNSNQVAVVSELINE